MKHYILVGASSGIGFELAKQLSKNHQVTAMARSEKELTSLPNVRFHELDLSQDKPLFPVIETPIDGLIYCPGTILLKPFRALKDEDFLNDFHINFMGAVRVIRNYLPQLLQSTQLPSIVLFSTVAVQSGMAFHSSIASAKGAVEGLARSLAAEFAPKIRVNAIAPSLTQTPLAEKLINAESKLNAAAERHPLKRIGSANDIAHAAIFLLQNEWITGQIIHVDGGMGDLR